MVNNQKSKKFFNLYVLDRIKSKNVCLLGNNKDFLSLKKQFIVLKYNSSGAFLNQFNPVYLYWWLIYLPRMICGKGGFNFYFIYEDGKVVLTIFLLPKCFKFPFMGDNDLFIGSVWTHPLCRRKGLLRFVFNQIKREYEEDLDNKNLKFWWMVSETNIVSIEVARCLGFSEFGLSVRKRWGIYKLHKA